MAFEFVLFISPNFLCHCIFLLSTSVRSSVSPDHLWKSTLSCQKPCCFVISAGVPLFAACSPCLHLVALVCTWLQGTNNKTTLHAVSFFCWAFYHLLVCFRDTNLSGGVSAQCNLEAKTSQHWFLVADWFALDLISPSKLSSNVLPRSSAISAGERL